MTHGTPHSVVAHKQFSPVETRNAPLRIAYTRKYIMWPRRVFLQWLIRNPKPATNFQFQVYRSGSPEGEWEHIGVDLDDVYYFVDEDFAGDAESPDLFSILRTLYYKVTVVGSDSSTAEVIENTGPWLDRRRAGLHRKLVRDAHRALQVANGTEVAVFKKRRWGELCDCLSSTGQPTQSHCSTCYGTKYKGGYWNPVYTYAWRGTRPVSVQAALQGEVEIRKINVIMPNVPQVEPGDFLAFLRDGRRYTVKEALPTQIHNVDVHQELVVSELNPSSVEFGLDIGPWEDPCWWVTNE